MEVAAELQTHGFALLTLKERCNFLKEKLNTVEEENVKLKVQLAKVNFKTDSNACNTNMLVEQIEILKKQKGQLSCHVDILAAENVNLWTRLSKITVLNQNLCRRFKKISETLDKHGIETSLSDIEFENSIASDSRKSTKDLEEMSLRLINSIKLEKTELEQQYDQMIALHEGNVNASGHELAFIPTDCDEETVMGAVRKHSQNMNLLKQTLSQQQRLLLNAFEDLRRLRNEQKGSCNKKDIMPKKDVSTEVDAQLLDIGSSQGVIEVNANAISVSNNEPENICPMCERHISGDFSKVFAHLSEEHFDIDIND